MTARTCRRCRGQEADETGLPCARCDGYGTEPVFPPEGPEPGRDEIEWMAAKVREANAARDTYTRSHDAACWAVHIDCANRRISALEAELMEARADLFDALGQPDGHTHSDETCRICHDADVARLRASLGTGRAAYADIHAGEAS